MNALICKNVEKKFGDFAALKGVSLEVEPGECFGLLGPNGAGKSTLISLIYGASSITKGELSVFGRSPTTQGRELRRQVGVVTQENHFDGSMTVIENMRMFSRYVGLAASEYESRIEYLLDYMMLLHKKNAVIESLSGGMQRRLVFVRALLHAPKLLILDEPTTGLDPAVRQLLWDKAMDLKKSGTTLILTTHYMDEAEKLCERLVILNEGRIQDQGSPRSLISKHCSGYIAVFGREASFDSVPKEFEVLEERGDVIVRAPSLEQLTSYISQKNLQPLSLRPSNLEDVFLKMTGRDLSDND